MITASLIGAGVPPLVQITVSVTPSGVPWVLTGTAGSSTWTVPGGAGIGDGNAVTLVDNRSPLNVPVVYTFTASTSESSAPLVVPAPATVDVVLQSLDGRLALLGRLQDGTQALRLDPRAEVFTVPGRRNQVARHTAGSSGYGSLIVRSGFEQTSTLDDLLGEGRPFLVRYAQQVMDLPAVQVVTITAVSSDASLPGGFREWVLGYVPTDDPYLDTRLGAFTWEYIDALQVQGGTVIRDGATMEAIMAGLSWDQLDAFDWSVLA